MPEIFRQSANEITGIASGFLHNPGKQRRSGCFAVRSRDYEVVTAPQKIIFQNFRQGEVKQFSIQDRFHFGVAPLHHVADDHYIRIARDVLCAIALLECDALLLEEARHWRINIFVRTSDLKAALLHCGRHRRHRGPANSEEMEVFRRFFHADVLRPVSRFG